MECGGDGGDGANCPGCQGRGRMELTGCPWLQVPADVWQALEAATRAKKGCWPISGGWLEQTRKCLDAVELAQAEENRAKANQRRKDEDGE